MTIKLDLAINSSSSFSCVTISTKLGFCLFHLLLYVQVRILKAERACVCAWIGDRDFNFIWRGVELFYIRVCQACACVIINNEFFFLISAKAHFRVSLSSIPFFPFCYAYSLRFALSCPIRKIITERVLCWKANNPCCHIVSGKISLGTHRLFH